MSLAEARREVIVEAPKDGRGGKEEPRRRALTMAEKLHNDGVLTYEEWQAAGTFRNMHFLLKPPSEGVSSYGQNTGGADPTRKGDRKAKRITGVEVHSNGTYSRGPSRDNKSDRWRYEDALFAMVGVHDDEGKRSLDLEAANIMIRVCTDSEYMPTQTEIGRMRAPYIKDEGKKPSKQITAIGGSFAKENLKRLARHFRMVKGAEVR
jgi:hypothetical protein